MFGEAEKGVITDTDVVAPSFCFADIDKPMIFHVGLRYVCMQTYSDSFDSLWFTTDQ